MSLSSNQSAHTELDTSADELALGTNIITTSDHRASVGARTKATPKASLNRSLKKLARTHKRPGTRSESIQKA